MDNLSSRLLDALKRRHKVHVRDSLWVGLRCPFCGDSSKPESHHLYIRLPKTDDKYVIKCFQSKCDVSGLLKREHLMTLGIHELEIYNMIDKVNIENVKFESISLEGIIMPLNVTPEASTYYENRTGRKLDEYEVLNRAIVGNLEDFLKYNEDKINTYPLKKFMSLNNPRECVGFLTHNGNMLYIRNIDPTSKYKHAKVSLLSEEDSYISKDWYQIDNGFSSFDYGCNNIIYGEGGFDVGNSIDMLKVEGLYIATGSINTMKSLFPIIAKRYYGVNYMFLGDEDVSDNVFKYLIKKNQYACTGKNIIIRNELSKDFGNVKEPRNIKIIEI